MKNITQKQLLKLAAEYDADPLFLESYIIDLEGDGLEVTYDLIDDFLANGDL